MTFQFKIQLKGISKPPVWRRVEVPASFTFDDLHMVIQTVFPWEDCHLYMFSPKGYGSKPNISLKDDDGWGEEPDLEADCTKLSKIFTTEKETYTYIYDFGDDWIHTITLEKITDKTNLFPICLQGKGSCPLEDCGGIWAYEDLKIILADPSHERYEEIREWYGFEEDDTFNPNEFDIESANEALKEIFHK